MDTGFGWERMKRGGQNNMCAFYFLFVEIFKGKETLADISIIFSFFIFGFFFFN